MAENRAARPDGFRIRRRVRRAVWPSVITALAVVPTVGRAQSARGSGPDVVAIDPRDGQGYRTITVSGYRWFAENLNFASPRSYCYGAEPENCARYGRLYRWEEALSACPPGWHLSTDYEWKELEGSVGVPFGELDRRGNRGTDEGGRLKVGGALGFDARFGGWREWEDGTFRAAGQNGAFWTATEADLKTAWHRDIDTDDDMIFRSRVDKPYALSVRCVEDWADEDAPPGAS